MAHAGTSRSQRPVRCAAERVNVRRGRVRVSDHTDTRIQAERGWLAGVLSTCNACAETALVWVHVGLHWAQWLSHPRAWGVACGGGCSCLSGRCAVLMLHCDRLVLHW
ncbi:hypothetical protein M3J09_000155 [Ascochyta lentis]